ncbi:MAG TPA: anti-sigma factor [Vicinamibacterales bacterium]|nr:anti-sigma factor [Vicinamibacterales bacterium]
MTTMSNHEEFAAALAGYALEALDGAERVALEAHLPTCAQCQAELAELRRVAAALGGAVVGVPPPPALKAKVIAHATTQKQAPQTPQAGTPARFLRRPAAAVPTPPAPMTPTPGKLVRVRVRRSRSPLPIAASVAIALGLGAYAWLLRSEIDSLRLQVTQMSIATEGLRKELTAVRNDAARFTHTAGVLAAPVLLKASLTGDKTRMPRATGRAFMNAERGVFFHGEHLDALPPGQEYQLWVIPQGEGAKPVPFPLTFTPDPNGAVSVNVPMPAAPSVLAIAVTIEPKGGSLSPTTPVVLSGAITPG